MPGKHVLYSISNRRPCITSRVTLQRHRRKKKEKTPTQRSDRPHRNYLPVAMKPRKPGPSLKFRVEEAALHGVQCRRPESETLSCRWRGLFLRILPSGEPPRRKVSPFSGKLNGPVKLSTGLRRTLGTPYNELKRGARGDSVEDLLIIRYLFGDGKWGSRLVGGRFSWAWL